MKWRLIANNPCRKTGLLQEQFYLYRAWLLKARRMVGHKSISRQSIRDNTSLCHKKIRSGNIEWIILVASAIASRPFPWSCLVCLENRDHGGGDGQTYSDFLWETPTISNRESLCTFFFLRVDRGEMRARPLSRRDYAVRGGHRRMGNHRGINRGWLVVSERAWTSPRPDDPHLQSSGLSICSGLWYTWIVVAADRCAFKEVLTRRINTSWRDAWRIVSTRALPKITEDAAWTKKSYT